jgi:hypothetical protein
MSKENSNDLSDTITSLEGIIPKRYLNAGKAIVESHAYRIANDHKKRIPTDQTENEAVEHLYGLGWSTYRIGTVLRRSNVWALDQLNVNGTLKRPPGPRPIVLPTNLCTMHADEKIPVSELAKRYDCSVETISREIKRQGGKLNHKVRGPRRIEIPDSYIQRFLMGEKIEVLSKEGSISGETIRRRFKEKGIIFKKGERRVEK